MKKNNRPDLSNRAIAQLLIALLVLANLSLWWAELLPAPGTVDGQIVGLVGLCLLMAPLVFSGLKRSGRTASPPAWFIAHVVATVVGCLFIFAHVARGNWFTPPGLVLLLMLFLVIQGSLMRTMLTRGFAQLFARSSAINGFAPARVFDKAEIARIIERKTKLLRQLDPGASEALFSPNLRHWLTKPLESLRYHRLAMKEADLIGARASSGLQLNWARRLHMLAALLFYLGLAAHLVVVLFFAGYAADGGTIDWWYITDWGK